MSMTPAHITRLLTFAQHGQPKGYAASDMMRADLEMLIRELTAALDQPPVVGGLRPEIDKELMARIALYDDGIHNRDNQDDLNMLVNHFVERGLDVAEAERDTQTEEMF